MSNRTFLTLAVVIGLLVLVMIYMHRPRSGSAARTLPLHDGR